MKAASLRWFLLAYFVLLAVAAQIRSNDMGASGPTWLDGNYGFEAGAPPWSLAIGVIGVGFFLALTLSVDNRISRSMPHLFRRWIAGWIDWILAFVAPTPFVGLAFVWVEYRRTGVFKWIIQSQEPNTLQLNMIVVFILSSMMLYFAVPWWLGKPTAGACIFGYRICPDDRSRFTLLSAIFRVILGCVALLGWPSWILSYFLKRDKSKGKFWLDAVCRTHAEYLT